MDIVLRGLHVGLGELGLLCIILVLVEVAWGTSARGILRAKIASLAGAILIFAHWLVSGVYYLTYYGAEVKPVIKAGVLAMGSRYHYGVEGARLPLSPVSGDPHRLHGLEIWRWT